MKIAFTLCSNNYLAQAKTLGDSFIKFNPQYEFIIGLIDKKNPEISYSYFEPYLILPVSDLQIQTFADLIQKYNVVEFNTAVKPFYFSYLFQKYNPLHILFFDPDILFFSDIDEVDNIFEFNDILLTPHLLKAKSNEVPSFETLLLNVGVYNLGFLGLKYSEQVVELLRWWQERMIRYCYIDFCNGLFVDQVWANLFPCYFEKIKIWKNEGCNIGYWNLDERYLTIKSESSYLVNEKFDLKFFHFSNYNPDKPDIISKWSKLSFADRPDLHPIHNYYNKLLIENKYVFFSGIQPLLNFAKTHPHLDKKRPSLKVRLLRKIKNFFNV